MKCFARCGQQQGGVLPFCVYRGGGLSQRVSDADYIPLDDVWQSKLGSRSDSGVERTPQQWM
eukprot:4298752-Lingulodinium_polyedra.AAC.1